MGIVLFYFDKIKRKYIPSFNLTIVLVFIGAFYSYYRFGDHVWNFTPFSNAFRIKYLDIVLIPAGLNMFLTIRALCLSKKNISGIDRMTNGFFEDSPLGEKGADELGFEHYAESLAKRIDDSLFINSFAIGINGHWGAGKTSFIDLVKRHLNTDGKIIINYNPWNSHSPKAIIQDFFDTIQENIRPYHSSLARQMADYASKLVAMNDNTLTQSIQVSVAAFTGVDSLSSMYEQINENLKQVGRKILVVIDDVDRLDKQELLEVIRLIRNTANFYNTVFLVAYDRNYVITALRDLNSYNHELFLEKIFQLEITLPYFDKRKCRIRLAERLKRAFTEDLHSTIEETIVGKPGINVAYLDEWIESMRDVTRLTNTLSLNFTKLQGEVVFSEFFRMELLRLKYPAVYEIIFRRTSEFLEVKGEKKARYLFKHFPPFPEWKLQKGKNLFENYLLENMHILSIPREESVKKIVYLLDGFFQENTWFSVYERHYLSLVYPSNFKRYFAYTLMEDNLSEVEFSNARRNLSQEDFNTKISAWVNNGFDMLLRFRFEEIKDFDNKEDFKKIIRGIFYLANHPIDNASWRYSRVGYDANNLRDKLTSNAKKLFFDNNTSEYKTFVLELFSIKSDNVHFESAVLKEWLHFSWENFVLTKKEMEDIVLGYFSSYCNTEKKMQQNHWYLFHCCKATDWLPEGASSRTAHERILDEAKVTMINFVSNTDLDGFLEDVIETEPVNMKLFSVNSIVAEIWEGWENFEQFLDEHDESKWKYLKEFKAFFVAFKSTGYSKRVPFNFKNIPKEVFINQ